MNIARVDKRRQLAQRVFQGVDSNIDIFMYPVLSNVTIAANGLASADADIEYQVNAVFDGLAGVTENELK